MALDFTVVTENLDYFLWGRTPDGEVGGLLLTVLMSVAAGSIAVASGVLLACVAWTAGGWIRRLLFAWADLIRAIPLIFVIFWMYFLLPRFLGPATPDAASVVAALAWFSAAAVMHTALAGIEALGRGQSEAAIAAGFTRLQALRLVILPQALPLLTPSFIGLLVMLIKDTSLAFLVNVPELTTVAGQVNNSAQVYPAEIFIFVGLLYFILCGGLSLAAFALEAAWRRRAGGPLAR